MGAGVSFDTWGTSQYSTNDGRMLEIAAGELRGVMSLRFEVRDADEQGTDVIACDYRIADCDGRLWTTTSLFTTELFVTHMVDLTHRNTDLFRLLPDNRRYKDATKNNGLTQYRQAFQKPLLLSGARFFSDDRDSRYIVIMGRVTEIRFKYLYLSLDIGSVSDEESFADWFSVRIPDQCLWDEQREHAIGPLAFDISCVHFLRHNTAAWDSEEQRWQNAPLSRPLIFSPVEGEGKPQANVRPIIAARQEEPQNFTA